VVSFIFWPLYIPKKRPLKNTKSWAAKRYLNSQQYKKILPCWKSANIPPSFYENRHLQCQFILAKMGNIHEQFSRLVINMPDSLTCCVPFPISFVRDMQCMNKVSGVNTLLPNLVAFLS
jgi:hypothetical protein